MKPQEEVDNVIDDFYKLIYKTVEDSTILNAENLCDEDLKFISSGSFQLDWALGHPLIEGSMIEIFGHDSVGKTTIALEFAASAQEIGKEVFYIDLERKLRRSLINCVRRLNPVKLHMVYPKLAEKTIDFIRSAIKEVPGCLIIVDSVGALLPEAESNTKTEDNAGSYGATAKLLSKTMRLIANELVVNKAAIIWINQLISSMTQYGSPWTTKGGRAIRYYSSQRIELKRNMADLIKAPDKTIIGQYVNCRVIKNNMCPPFREARLPIIYGEAIAIERDLVEFAISIGIIETSGKGRYVHPESKKKVFMKDLIKTYKENNELIENLKKQISDVY